jgi:hypothetical protein
MAFDRGSEYQRRLNLRDNGATEEEIEFLLHHRVELNAMTSDQLVAWLERKLVAHGVKKLVPSNEKLVDLYRLTVEAQILEYALPEVQQRARVEAEQVAIPADLHDRVDAMLRDDPGMSWDTAVAAIVSAAPYCRRGMSDGPAERADASASRPIQRADDLPTGRDA